MGAGVGVSAISDIYGIISAQRQQARMRKIYDMLMNPSALASNVNQLYTPLSEAAQREIMRYSQAEMGTRGVGDSQYAGLHAARAYAPIEARMRESALQAYMNALGQATGAVGTPYGTSGSLARSLGSMAQFMMLRNARNQPQAPPPGVAGTPRGRVAVDPLALQNTWHMGSFLPGGDYMPALSLKPYEDVMGGGNAWQNMMAPYRYPGLEMADYTGYGD
jgi:hypothetical protein